MEASSGRSGAHPGAPVRMRAAADRGRRGLSMSAPMVRPFAGWSGVSGLRNDVTKVGCWSPNGRGRSRVPRGHGRDARPRRTGGPRPRHRRLDGFTDPSGYMWALAWWPHALLHGVNPLFTHAIWAPEGTSVAAAATIPWLRSRYGR